MCARPRRTCIQPVPRLEWRSRTGSRASPLTADLGSMALALGEIFTGVRASGMRVRASRNRSLKAAPPDRERAAQSR